jgi:molecular chaperone DnaK
MMPADVMAARAVAFGVDLGTRLARGAFVSETRPLLVCDADETGGIPAVVGVDPAGARVGRTALARAAVSPATTVFGAKWWLGRRHADVIPFRRDAADRIVAAADGRALIRAGSRAHDPAEIAAHLIGNLAELAGRQCGTRPASVVLAAPPWLGTRGFTALRDAAARAGLAVDRVVGDAAALALTLPAAQKPAAQLVAIVDAGAGGISASILKVSSAQIVTLGSAGDDQVGGDTVDRAIMGLLRGDLGARAPESGAGIAEMLRALAEGMKCDLSEAAEAGAVASFLPGAPSVSLDCERLEPLLVELCDRLDRVCSFALDEAGIAPGEVALVYAAGGMAQVPSVRARIERCFRRRPLVVHPSRGLVALGTATLAGMLAGEIPDVPVLDLTANAPSSQQVLLDGGPRSPAMDERRGAPSSGGAPPSWALERPPWAVGPPSSGVGQPASSGERPLSGDGPPSPRGAPPSWAAERPPWANRSPSSGGAPPSPGGGRPAWAGGPRSPAGGPPSPSGGRPSGAGGVPSSAGASPPSSGASSPRPQASQILVGGGRFARPADASALLGLPIMRPLAVAANLAPMALPVLFARVLARESVRGVLALAHGGRGLSVPVLGGRVCLGRAEQQAVAQAFAWPEGTYDFHPKDVPAGREPPTSLLRLAVAGVRVLGRTFTTEDMEEALGVRLDQAPRLRSGSEAMVKRFGLDDGELQLIEHGFDGVETGKALLHGDLGRRTTLELMLVLTLFDAVVWAECGHE